MPAVTVDNPLVLPRIAPVPPTALDRQVNTIVDAAHVVEGAGFEVWRPFPAGGRGAGVDSHTADPFFLLDQLGPVEYAPNEAVGAPWHPHRGFETVTYVIDGVVEHHDSNGGGGIIGEGDTQWMTAGSGILHDEVPTETFRRNGGRTHGVQLWVNLPARLKFTPPRYQAIEKGELTLLSSPDGGTLVRLIAGSLAGPDGVHEGPGSTHTPITYAHATLSPGAELHVPWPTEFGAMVYVLGGRGTVGREQRPIDSHQLAVFGAGDAITVRAADAQTSEWPNLEVLLLGGLPIREPIVHYGPFLMNTRQEIVQALDDLEKGLFGRPTY